MGTTVSIGASNVNSQGLTTLQYVLTMSGNNIQGESPWSPNSKSNAFSIQMTQPVQTLLNLTLTVPVPLGAVGVIIQPPAANTGGNTLGASTVSSANSITELISPIAPSDRCFDGANLPTNLYLHANAVFGGPLWWY